MKTILEKLAQKTTWLGIAATLVPLLAIAGVIVPAGLSELAASVLAGIAGIVLIFVNPK